MFRTCEVSELKIYSLTEEVCVQHGINGLIDPIDFPNPSKEIRCRRETYLVRPSWFLVEICSPTSSSAGFFEGDALRRKVYLNGRSLLNLATGVAHGFVALFPEEPAILKVI